MNCTTVKAQLSAYVDGELPNEEMLSVRSHLFDCEGCSDEYEAQKVVKNLLSSMETATPSDDFEERLTARVFGEPKPQRTSRLSLAWVSGFAFVGAFLSGFLWLESSQEAAVQDSVRASEAQFQFERDQAYMGQMNRFSGGNVILTSSNGD